MPKFTNTERTLIKSIVASLSIKRIPESEIIKEIFQQTNKTITKASLFNVKNRIKRDSFKWYKTMREGEYEYLHEFKERVNEIMDLQRKHHEIIDNNPFNPQIQQTSLAELHKLTITLSNLYDVAPTIIGIGPSATISTTPEIKNGATRDNINIIV